MRLRYQTIPAKRQEIFTYIIQTLLKEFSDTYPKVRFAMPSQIMRYSPDEETATHPADTGLIELQQ